MTYYGRWDSVNDIEIDFALPNCSLKDENIFFAVYDIDGYDGEALVIFRGDNGVLLEVHASHCSCYGLEDMWRPEVTSLESIEYRLENATYGYFHHYKNEIRKGLNAIVT